ncbi:hypothetical protein J4E80_010196 [Alternaria sp. BMP 0032]|nr:hypothetical protein J4E80_010196 [Alternaria sp. BMP 0032]
MPAFNLECVEDAPNATGPIIEDITEFCDFCVVLVKFILERSQPDMEALNAIADSTPDYAREAGIAFEDLPKTFQDVVRFAQAIGITYIWIESLCIIQDDHQDWISEAAKMGDVYRNAALVVAASGAKDCSGGLSITDRPRARVFRLPFIDAGETKGTFNIMPLSKDNRNPADGPLEKRAWTLQERWLARRFVSFMPQGITWKCKRGERAEAGGSFKAFTPFNGLEGPRYEWDKLLSAYTSRLLTIPSDRTEAIKGIAEEVQRSRKDEYLPDCGIWTGGPISQLLWLKDGPCIQAEKLSTVPSWSWAATESAKKWPEAGYPTRYVYLTDAEVPERLAVTTENQLLVSGHLSTSRHARSHLQDEKAERELAPAELKQLYYWWNRNGQENHEFHVLTQEKHDSQEQAVLGIARFDLDGVSSYTHAGIFAKQKSWQTEGVTESPATEQIVNGVVYHIERYPFCVYWALLLELVDGNRFRRVGMALLLPIAYEVFQVQVQDYEII